MADKVIFFGQRERSLKFDIAAMLALEEAMGGKPTGEIVASLGRWSFTALVLVLWAGFRHEDRNLTIPLTRKALEVYVNAPGANVRQLRKDVTDAIESSSWYKQIDTRDDDEDDEQEADANP